MNTGCINSTKEISSKIDSLVAKVFHNLKVVGSVSFGRQYRFVLHSDHVTNDSLTSIGGFGLFCATAFARAEGNRTGLDNTDTDIPPLETNHQQCANGLCACHISPAFTLGITECASVLCA